MRIISPLPPLRPVATIGRDLVRGTKAETTSAETRPQARAASSSISVDSLIALATVDSDRERRRKLAEDCANGIEVLENLHRDLVSGAINNDGLDRLSTWLHDHDTPKDPVLAALMQDIELRVQIELAKRGR